MPAYPFSMPDIHLTLSSFVKRTAVQGGADQPVFTFEKIGLVVGVANEQSASNGARKVTGGVHYIDDGYSTTW